MIFDLLSYTHVVVVVFVVLTMKEECEIMTRGNLAVSKRKFRYVQFNDNF